jgi:hypothetical protein
LALAGKCVGWITPGQRPAAGAASSRGFIKDPKATDPSPAAVSRKKLRRQI